MIKVNGELLDNDGASLRITSFNEMLTITRKGILKMLPPPLAFKKPRQITSYYKWVVHSCRFSRRSFKARENR